MLGHQFAYSAAPVRKVKEVQFGILSPEEIVRRPPLFCIRFRADVGLDQLIESLLSCQDRTPRGYG